MRTRSERLSALILLSLLSFGLAACGSREQPSTEQPSTEQPSTQEPAAQEPTAQATGTEENSAQGSGGEGAATPEPGGEGNSAQANLEGEALVAAIGALPEPFRPLFAADLDQRYRWAYNADYESADPLRDAGEVRCRHVAVRRFGERLGVEWACSGRTDTDDENEELHLVWLAGPAGLWLDPRAGSLSVTLDDLARSIPDRAPDLPFPLAASQSTEGEEGAQTIREIREERLRDLRGSPSAWCLHEREEPSEELTLCLHPSRGMLLWHSSGYPTEERWRVR